MQYTHTRIDWRPGDEWPAGTEFKFSPGVNRHNGYQGLCPDANHFPGFDPVGAEAALHDILEHFPGDPPDVPAELMAQGASILLRAEGGWFPTDEALWERVDGAFGLLADSYLLRWLTDGTHSVPDNWGTPSGRPLFVGTSSAPARVLPAQTWIWEYLSRFTTACIPAALEKMAPGVVDKAFLLLHDIAGKAAAWMAAGYRRASARYAEHSLHLVRQHYADAVDLLTECHTAACSEIVLTFLGHDRGFTRRCTGEHGFEVCS